ncbi:hypothetical protein TNCV_2746771 [Trichonephila clavipes]|nr:hypothetical protein TNCV_2746771 [Trichonephila clavipes]
MTRQPRVYRLKCQVTATVEIVWVNHLFSSLGYHLVPKVNATQGRHTLEQEESNVSYYYNQPIRSFDQWLIRDNRGRKG